MADRSESVGSIDFSIDSVHFYEEDDFFLLNWTTVSSVWMLENFQRGVYLTGLSLSLGLSAENHQSRQQNTDWYELFSFTFCTYIMCISNT